MTPLSGATDLVPFSVVVPAKDEGTVVERCLSFLTDLTGELRLLSSQMAAPTTRPHELGARPECTS